MEYKLFVLPRTSGWEQKWSAGSVQQVKVHADEYYPRLACQVRDANDLVVAYRTDAGSWKQKQAQL